MRLSCISFLKEEKRGFFKQFTFCIVMFSSIIANQEYVVGKMFLVYLLVECHSFCHYFNHTGKHILKCILYCTIHYTLLNDPIISISIYHSSLLHLIQWSYI